MTRIGQMIFDDGVVRGREQGREEGREEGRREGQLEGEKAGTERMSALITKLMQENRLDELQRIAVDETLRESLMKEFGIL